MGSIPNGVAIKWLPQVGWLTVCGQLNHIDI